MVLVLSELYVRFGGLPWMQGLFYGIGAAVIAIIARSALKLVRMTLGRDHLRSEEHTSELQSRSDLVCRLLLEKKKNTYASITKLSSNTSPTAPALATGYTPAPHPCRGRARRTRPTPPTADSRATTPQPTAASE